MIEPLRRQQYIDKNVALLNELPSKYEVFDQSHFIELKSQRRMINETETHPQDKIISFDLVGELQGKIFAKILMNKNNQSFLSSPFKEKGLIDSLSLLLGHYLDRLDHKLNIMSEIGAIQNLGIGSSIPLSYQMDHEEWIRFSTRYIWMNDELNIPVELSFQFVKKGTHRV